jgi:hypothetical protein
MRQLVSFVLPALLSVALTHAHASQTDQQTAAAIWEQAIAAKGGRERLAAIHSFAIHEKTVFNHPVAGIAAGKVDQVVCVLPDRWWEFLDYRPGKMGYSVTSADARTGLGWSTMGGPARPYLRPNTGLAHRLRRLQYVYFLETSAVRPTPTRASRVRRGFRAVDRIEAAFDVDIIVVDLDVDTHLPIRVETITPNTLPPPRPGMKPPGDTKFVYELSQYEGIGGIKVPTRLKLGGDTTRAQVEINPDYEPSIFTTPPSPDATADSWKR